MPALPAVVFVGTVYTRAPTLSEEEETFLPVCRKDASLEMLGGNKQAPLCLLPTLNQNGDKRPPLFFFN